VSLLDRQGELIAALDNGIHELTVLLHRHGVSVLTRPLDRTPLPVGNHEVDSENPAPGGSGFALWLRVSSNRNGARGRL
jgi:hypothetical protein